MSYSIDALTDNCYPGTSVLINKFDINDDEQLQKVEALVVSAKIAQLEQFPITGIFDFSHYKAIHRELFCDLYDWAGQVRTVDFSKKGTHFCPASDIDGDLLMVATIQSASGVNDLLKDIFDKAII